MSAPHYAIDLSCRKLILHAAKPARGFSSTGASGARCLISTSNLATAWLALRFFPKVNAEWSGFLTLGDEQSKCPLEVGALDQFGPESLLLPNKLLQPADS
jgi:hypothetical protein